MNNLAGPPACSSYVVDGDFGSNAVTLPDKQPNSNRGQKRSGQIKRPSLESKPPRPSIFTTLSHTHTPSYPRFLHHRAMPRSSQTESLTCQDGGRRRDTLAASPVEPGQRLACMPSSAGFAVFESVLRQAADSLCKDEQDFSQWPQRWPEPKLASRCNAGSSTFTQPLLRLAFRGVKLDQGLGF